ncbi:MAG: hypothetical protein QOJ22_1194 [Thermoleophilaceae bacterium]|jgi:hypothetical protein|nr:hypothetical protein [Thermoleophilaceae bacterium]
MLRRTKQTGAPDFVGVGIELAGTVWWMRLLKRHPQIVGPRGGRVGTQYFREFCGREMTEDEVADYHSRFPRRPGQIAGEFCNRYSFEVWAIPLIARTAPDAKLVLVLRDPIDIYARILGFRLAKRSARFSRAAPDETIYMTEIVHRARFGAQLRTLTQLFDRDRILVLQMERILRDPVGQYRRTCRFLGVSDDYVPRALKREAYTGSGPLEHARVFRPLGLPPWVNLRPLKQLLGRPVARDAALWQDIDASLHAELDPEVEALLAYRPGFDMSLWRNFAHLPSA